MLSNMRYLCCSVVRQPWRVEGHSECIVEGEEEDVIDCDQGRIWREHLELVSDLGERIGGLRAPLRANQNVVKRQGGRGCAISSPL
ncbi:uncharacterized protein BDZ99DRAFT_513679 [Mytilinidion resinicola]|uniref:Uncharacterized protein n=1 Tax=Mytilinidion resinicola TaxID=574789 RepID=A0A6A6Z8H8_9PEZI|nr:uncharacterized protein BDZ99DRAFT_513679 [Mytilinidion resinicola]KAF2817431.1 hypothetical protein BDZ99DRAFT_513679 [Mytilinidion resinicola]